MPVKVFMLGWEFPPVVSGGLGVACYGLAKALNSAGVDVLFVLPKPLSKNGQKRIPGGGVVQETRDVITTATTSVAPAVPETLLLPALVSQNEISPDPAAPEQFSRTAPEPVWEKEDVLAEVDAPIAELTRETLQRVTFVPVDSWLQPYLTPAQYQKMVVEDLHENRPVTRWEKRFDKVGERWVQRSVVDVDARSDPVPSAAPPPPPANRDFIDEPPSSQQPVMGDANSAYAGDLFLETERYARLALGIAKTEEFDVIHAHDWMTFEAAIAVAAETGKPLVVQIHSTEIDRAGMSANERILEAERRGMNAATRIVAVSYKTKTQLVQQYAIDPAKIDVVYNAVEQAAEEPVIVKPRKKHKTVLFLGRMTRQKGPDYFLQAAKKLLSVEPDVKFIMAGKGEMIEELKGLAEDLGIHRRVIFTGFLKKTETERAFRSADVYVMPSVSEPFGIAPLEALSHDVPVIISKQSGVAEILQHVLKVDFWDTEDLANKILAVLRHPPLAATLREEGLEEVRQLSWDDSAEKIVEIYTRLLPRETLVEESDQGAGAVAD